MTRSEFKAALDAMSQKEFEEFKKTFGGDGTTKEWYLNTYSQHEERLSEILGYDTEADRSRKREAAVAQAAIESAAEAKTANDIARAANNLARKSMTVAWASLAVSILSIVVSILCAALGGK